MTKYILKLKKAYPGRDIIPAGNEIEVPNKTERDRLIALDVAFVVPTGKTLQPPKEPTKPDVIFDDEPEEPKEEKSKKKKPGRPKKKK
jgi:hypothetical protein